MSPHTASTGSIVPVHLSIVGGLSLLWNAFGAFDYVMTQMHVEAYMSGFNAEQLEYFYGFPAWVDAAWAFGVWGSVVGSVGLLLRRRWAAWAFAASLFGLVGSTAHTTLLTDGIRIMGGPGVLVFSAVIWLVAIGLLLYARAMSTSGTLL